MLRVLFCMNCCGGPQLNRRPPARRKVSAQPKSGKLIDGKTLEYVGSREHLSLVNQIEQAKHTILTGKPGQMTNTRMSADIESEQNFGMNILEASTSTKQEVSLADAVTPASVTTADDNNNNNNNIYHHEITPEPEIRPTSSTSSIDVDQFRENQSYVGQEESQVDDRNEKWYRSSEPLDTNASTRMPSVSKIGEYARLEYSPVEDLDSITNKSLSRAGSEPPPGGHQRSRSRASSPNVGDGGAQNLSQGMESSSISIASQLSNEIEQSLTNMLESANSPTTMFGTIGLPLGPPLDNSMTETRKTSPDTNGAALTSQDSLSDCPMPPSPARRATTIGESPGAALVGVRPEPGTVYDTLEQSYATLPASSKIAGPISKTNSFERLTSAASLASTYSATLGNPTPTPSEVSSKKSKISAKSLFKKLKPKKKKKSEGS